uniref:protein-L-isoaspartate(D-aspartate) O-methyltransferase n=1 Tax=Polypedilum vanderplanki TaxID=319348 RepID=S6BND7_POLVA|nr:protein L-isoaspartyl methyltransferase [Polypedilum vanderplanki]
MALQLQSDSNTDFIKKLQDFGVIKHKIVATAMKETDRKYYSNLPSPYVDRLEIIDANAVLSAPHMHAYALEKLVDRIRHDSKILDIGSGSGYLTACFARLIQERAFEKLQIASGFVIAIEPHERVYKHSIENILTDNSELIMSGLIKIFHGDGKKEIEQYEPFDIIHVGAALSEIPTDLLMHLNLNGRLICPVGDKDGEQQMMQFDKNSAGEVSKKVLTKVIFDPLKATPVEYSHSEESSLDEQPWTDTTDDESEWSEHNKTPTSDLNEPEFVLKE